MHTRVQHYLQEAATVADGPSTSGKRHKLTTEQWRQMYEKDGTVDLFLQDDFNAGVRMVVRAHGMGLSAF